MSDEIDYSGVVAMGDKALLTTLQAADARNSELCAEIDRLRAALAEARRERDRFADRAAEAESHHDRIMDELSCLREEHERLEAHATTQAEIIDRLQSEAEATSPPPPPAGERDEARAKLSHLPRADKAMFEECRKEVKRLRAQIQAASSHAPAAAREPDAGLARALDLLAFHEGSAQQVYDEEGDVSANFVVAIEESDFEEILAGVREAVARAATPAAPASERDAGDAGQIEELWRVAMEAWKSAGHLATDRHRWIRVVKSVLAVRAMMTAASPPASAAVPARPAAIAGLVKDKAGRWHAFEDADDMHQFVNASGWRHGMWIDDFELHPAGPGAAGGRRIEVSDDQKTRLRHLPYCGPSDGELEAPGVLAATPSAESISEADRLGWIAWDAWHGPDWHDTYPGMMPELKNKWQVMALAVARAVLEHPAGPGAAGGEESRS